MGGNNPLELRFIPIPIGNGTNKEAPALHKMWAVRRSWSPYSPPPSGPSLDVLGAEDTWLLQARKVESDLSWLLHLPCHKFWSQLVHDESLHKYLESVLQAFPRQHDVSVERKEEELVGKNVRILHKLFLVFVRLCTYKESATDFMSPEYFGNLIYDKFLLDIPKLMDVCVLFAPCNQAIVSKMVANVLKCQPKYLEDLASTGDTLGQAFESFSERLQVIQMAIQSDETCGNLLDLVYYMIDIGHTLSCLLEVCPPVAGPLHATGLECRVANLYQVVLVEVSALLTKFHDQGFIAKDVFRQLMTGVKMSRHCLIKIFRSIVSHCCLTPAVEGDHVDPLAENYLHIMTTALSERSFLVDYDKRFPLQEDFEMFNQAGANIDNTRKHYILDGIVAPVLQQTKNSTKKETSSQPIEPEPTKSSAKNNDVKKCPGGVEVASLISTVRDLLPYLGEGFVEKCLSHYDWKVDDVVNALLEANLPPHLAKMDQSEGRTVEAVPEEPPRSIYEADEFDVNTWDSVDVSKVHRGKKKKGKDANSMLEDKSVINSMRERYSELGIIKDVEVLVAGEAAGNDYDDEYDDTYDDNPVGPDEVDENQERRPFVLPRALGGGHVGKTVTIEEEESEEDEDDWRKKKDFTRNPEEVRADRERAFQHKMSRGRGGGAPRVRDVVGKEKGQGQEKSVLINRSRKTANKGKAQRAGADRKQAKGMF